MGVAEAWLLGGAAVGYALAWVLLGTSLLFGIRRAPTWIRWLLGAGLVLHAAAIGVRWASIGHPPLFGTFETAMAGTWFILLLTALVLWQVKGLQPLALVTLPVALGLGAHGLGFPTKAYPLTISERSLWVDLHALAGWVTLASYAMAFACALALLVRGAPLRADAVPAGLLDDYLSWFVSLGFVTQTILIASGAYYSFVLFGQWWRWDPVESLSLISWLLYGLAIHMRLFFGWRARRGAWVAVVCMAALLVAYKAVPSLPPGSTYHIFDLRFP